MFTDYRTTAWFCYVMSLSLMGICAYTIFYVPGTHPFVYAFAGVAFSIWLSMGHLNDVFFNLKTLLVYREIAKNLDKIAYVSSHVSGADKVHDYYLTSEAEFYNIQVIRRLAYGRNQQTMVCLDYRISATTEFSKGAYVQLNHPITTLTDRYERLIHNRCIDLIPLTEGSLEDRLERIDSHNLAKTSAVRKHTIDEVLKDLANE